MGLKRKSGVNPLFHEHGGIMIEEQVKDLIQEIIENSGYILDSVEYVKEDSNMFLRVIIDKTGIIDIDDCVTVSKLINPILDKADLIKENYILDVCSKEKGSV